MKKLLVLLGILAAFSFVACDKEANPPAPEVPAFDGNVDLTKLAEYDEAAGGLVKDFGTAVNGYDLAFSYKLSDLGYTD